MIFNIQFHLAGVLFARQDAGKHRRLRYPWPAARSPGLCSPAIRCHPALEIIWPSPLTESRVRVPPKRNEIRPKGRRSPRLVSLSGSFAMKGVSVMPLFEVETASHIMIAWADDADAGKGVCDDQLSHGGDHPGGSPSPRRLGHFQEVAGHSRGQRSLSYRPRLPGQVGGPQTPRGKALHAGDRHRSEGARKAVESNMSRGW